VIEDEEYDYQSEEDFYDSDDTAPPKRESFSPRSSGVQTRFKKSLRTGDFDLDNVIIPASPNTQIPVIRKKEIFTPTWRSVDTDLTADLLARVKMDDPPLESSGEDTSDEYYIRQHAIKEVEEQRRYTEPLANNTFKRKTHNTNSKDLSKIPKTSFITEFFCNGG